jgi:flagellar biosynthesis chaperone FliJ
MALLRGLRRLLQLRHLEEDQSRLALESALAKLHQLERAVEATAKRGINSRELVRRGVRTGELPDRIAGLEEGRAALRQAACLEGPLSQSRKAAEILRESYQSARVERRQVETLLQEADAAASLDADRRSQQALDDWFGRRRQAVGTAAGRSREEEKT